MRIRGRRVVLLIAGALPLLAEDDIAAVVRENLAVEEPKQRPTQLVAPEPVETGEAETDSGGGNVGAAESLHDEKLSLLSLNMLQVEAEFSGESTYVQGKVKIIEAASADVKEDPEGTVADQVEETLKEPPDENHGEEEVEDKQAATDDESTEEEDQSAPGNAADDDHHATTAAGDEEEEQELEGEESEFSGDISSEEVDDPEEDDPSKEEVNNTDATTIVEDDFAEVGEVPIEPRNDDNATTIEDNDAKNINATVPVPTEPEPKDTTTNNANSSSNNNKKDQPELNKILQVDYASKSAGALVLEKSSNFKGTSNLLNGDRDRYAIAPCSENPKFVVVSLSEDILVKQVKLANYELYSSRVKDYEIQISQTMGNWVDLGSYTAKPTSGVQTFELQEPAWGRYLKFKFTSHYGDEFYCTLSQIMVHGSTMVQGFHEHLQETNNEEEEIILNDPDSGGEGGAVLTTTTKEADDNALEAEKAEGPTTATELQPTTSGGSAVGDVDVGQQDGPKGPSGNDSPESSDAAGAGDKESASRDDTAGETTTASNEEGENNGSDGHEAKETTTDDQEERIFGTALPSASIGLSSNVFTTIIGKLEPLHLKKRVVPLGEISPPAFPDSEKLNNILAKASDSTIAIKNALTDPAILENLQSWGERRNKFGLESVPPEAFGSTAIGPREQTLAEKLAAYIQDQNHSQMRPFQREDAIIAPSGNHTDVVQSDGDEVEEINNEEDVEEEEAEEVHGQVESGEQPSESTKGNAPGNDSYASMHDTDLALAAVLERLPSIACLRKLDFAAFKEKAMASRRGAHGGSGSTAAGHAMEPIFKMLTDQIKTLQSNLLVHDQFTKEAVQCYQSVLMDVVVEMQSQRMNHEARLSKLEQDLQETKTVRWVFVVYQLIMGLPNWASLFAATFFTSFVSPTALMRPLEIVEGFLEKHVPSEVHFVLSWTITGCIMILSVVTTVSLCQRIVSTLKGYKERFSHTTPSAPKDPAEEVSCRLSVENANGEIVPVGSDHSEEEALKGERRDSSTPNSQVEDEETGEVESVAATFHDSLSMLPASPSSVAKLADFTADEDLKHGHPEQSRDQNESMPPSFASEHRRCLSSKDEEENKATVRGRSGAVGPQETTATEVQEVPESLESQSDSPSEQATQDTARRGQLEDEPSEDQQDILEKTAGSIENTDKATAAAPALIELNHNGIMEGPSDDAAESNETHNQSSDQHDITEQSRGSINNNNAIDVSVAVPGSCELNNISLAGQTPQDATGGEKAFVEIHEVDKSGRAAAQESCDTTVAEETSSKAESSWDAASDVKPSVEDNLETSSEAEDGTEMAAPSEVVQNDVAVGSHESSVQLTKPDDAGSGALLLKAEPESDGDSPHSEVGTAAPEDEDRAQPKDAVRNTTTTNENGQAASHQDVRRSPSSNAIDTLPLAAYSAVESC